MSQKLKAGVLGVGYLGRFHAQKYSMLPEVEFIGVYDANLDRAKEVAAELKCEAFVDMNSLIAKVDMVTIASPTTTHFEVAKKCLESGLHIHIEKPMTQTTAEAVTLCELAEKKGLKIQVGHVERFNPALIEAKKKLRTPLFIECHRLAPFKPRSTDVSVVLDLMIHDIDVVLNLVKSEIASISAVGTPVLTKTHDIANARIEFKNGAVANMTASRVSQRSARKFRIFQENQYLSMDFGTGEVNLLTKTGEYKDGEIPLDVEAWNLEKGDALLSETKSFIEAVTKNKDPEVTGRDGLKALKVSEQIMMSIDAHRRER